MNIGRYRVGKVRGKTGTGCLTLGLLGLVVVVSGCAAHRDGTEATAGKSGATILAKGNGPLPAVKPEGVLFQKGAKEWEMGPPPYGYIKILGHGVPGWEPGDFETRVNPLSWTFVGPRPMSSEYWSGEGNAGGRIASIAPHPTDANTVYIATAGGGVWKTTNGGTNWSPLTDTLSILNGGTVAIDPSSHNTVYFGSGDLKGGSNGDGLFRSLDAGVTWVKIATTAQVGNQVNSIVINPTNPNNIHLSGSSGYYRSTDGGTTWSLRLSSTCWHVLMSNTNPNALYVARNGQGVYRSLDGGTTLTKLVVGLPASGFSRVELAISKSNPNVLYAAFINGGSSIGLYKTTDGGTTWIQKPATPNFCSGQCWYDAYIGVDPANENRVFLGGVDPRYTVAGILRSINGGDTWAEVSDGPSTPSVHPDHHVIAWGPTGIIWEGNDGGIYKSTDGGTNWSNMNSTLGAALIYDIEVHPTSVERMMGGTQDNGTPERTGASFTWPQLQVGDGGFSVFDPSVTTRRYTTYVYLSITRWNSGSGTGISGPWGSDPTNFIAPLVGDPNSSTTLLGGTNRIWRTLNATSSPPTWTAISTTAVGAGGTINAIAVAKGASNTIYSGSTSGKVYVTTNASTWTLRSTGLPAGQISDIVVSPISPGTAYVSFYNTSGGRVFRTVNFGVNWTNVTGTLPVGVSVTALEVDFDWPTAGMYVGSGAGVYLSLDDGATWVKNDVTFPNVNVGDLAIDRVNRTIVAGTYGRGAWRAGLPEPCPADYNGDGFVDGIDSDLFNNDFEAGNPNADYNGDGFVDGIDSDQFNNDFESGC